MIKFRASCKINAIGVDFFMPNLFKITKNEKTSYLYGTIHFSVDEVCGLSAEAKHAFEQASHIVLEQTPEDLNKVGEYLITQFDEWKKQIPDEFYNTYSDYVSVSQLKKIAELFGVELTQTNPSHLTLFQIIETSPILLCLKIQVKHLQNLGLMRTNYNLDVRLANQATSIGKPVASLDTLKDIARRILGFSYSYQEQVEYAEYTLHKLLNTSLDKLKKQYDVLINLYLAGDNEKLTIFLDSLLDTPMSKSINKSLVLDRDSIFVHSMQNYLDSGNAFFAMGAADLPGVLALLKDSGCIIEAIEEGKRIHSIHSLKNTYTSLRKVNLSTEIKRSTHSNEQCNFFGSQNNTFSQHNKEDLPILSDSVKEKETNRPLKM